MERYIELNEISDGRRYGINDMVKADCNGCMNCHACCQHMEHTIILDPLDSFMLMKGLGTGFEELLASAVELNVCDGIILPNLKMTGPDEVCAFLNEQGRCSVHAFRPGICRMFPLGRIYENGSFSYFLQTNECPYETKSKIKVKKWIDCADLDKNQKFINDWHYFVRELQQKTKETAETDFAKTVSMKLLKLFYFLKYDCDRDFYEQFYERMKNF
jgi:hypothetical protein